MAEAVDMAARRKHDSKQLAFMVRGHTTPELSGSVPCQIFEAEPNSVLNRTYNGEWAYATDEQGRARINSDPAHWPFILNWLSFGSIPAKPAAGFIAECKYWQLDNLLVKIEEQRTGAAEPPVVLHTAAHKLSLAHVQEDGKDGFKLEGSIFNFVNRFQGGKQVDTSFEAFGKGWRLEIKPKGAFLCQVTGMPTLQANLLNAFGKGASQWPINGAPSAKQDFKPPHTGWGNPWPGADNGARVQSFPCIDIHGSLRILVKVLFQKAS